MSKLVQVEMIEPGVTRVVLNRPERRNALNMDLLRSLCDTLDRLAADPSQRVVILGGVGPVFSAGLDLKEAADATLVEASAQWVHRALQTLRETPLIVIGAIHGGAFAGGAGLMAACDIVIATADAQIGFPEAQRGLLPALIMDVLHPKVRDGDLRELFLTGEPIKAHRAQQVGLVQRVVAPEHLLDEAFHVARAILKGGPETIRATKKLLNDAAHSSRSGTSDALLTTHLEARRSEEAREGLAAFLEKRVPTWAAEKHAP